MALMRLERSWSRTASRTRFARSAPSSWRMIFMTGPSAGLQSFRAASAMDSGDRPVDAKSLACVARHASHRSRAGLTRWSTAMGSGSSARTTALWTMARRTKRTRRITGYEAPAVETVKVRLATRLSSPRSSQSVEARHSGRRQPSSLRAVWGHVALGVARGSTALCDLGNHADKARVSALAAEFLQSRAVIGRRAPSKGAEKV